MDSASSATVTIRAPKLASRSRRQHRVRVASEVRMDSISGRPAPLVDHLRRMRRSASHDQNESRSLSGLTGMVRTAVGGAIVHQRIRRRCWRWPCATDQLSSMRSLAGTVRW